MSARDLDSSLPAGTGPRTTARRGPWDRLLRLVGRAPFAVEVVAGWHCALDRRTPLFARLLLAAAFVYVLSPIDLIPDVVAVLGVTDDVAVLWAALRGLRAHITDAHRARARRTFRLDDPI